MSDDATDPALLPEPDELEAELSYPACTSAKERNSLTLGQRRALRRWANNQLVRPSHKACIDWFFGQYGQQISQSTVSHSLSPKYSRLDGENPQLSGSRLRFGNWPDVERLVLLWYHQVQASGRHPTNEELADKAKAIFHQLPRYRDEVAPEFSPGWIHRFKKRYGLLIRRQRRHADGSLDPAQDIDYLADCAPRFMTIAPDTSPAAIREQILRVVGVEASLNVCALARDEVLRRIAVSQHAEPPPDLDFSSPETDPASQPHPHPHPQPPPPPTQPEPIYAEDDPEVVLQNALRQLQEEERAAEEQAAAVREERERAERAGLPPPPTLLVEAGRPPQQQQHHARYDSPSQEIPPELSLTPIQPQSEAQMTHHDVPLRCPFCINQRMLRSIKEAVEHMSTHVVV